MTAFLDGTEQDIINHIARGTAYPKPNGGLGNFLVAYEAQPADDNTGAVEMSDANYVRQPAAQDAVFWTAPVAVASGIEIENSSPVVFPAPATNGPDVIAVGIAPGAAANPIMAGATNNPISVVSGVPITFAAGSIKFRIDSVNMTDILGALLLNHIFRNTTMPQATNLFIDLYTTNAGKNGLGGIPYSGNNYSPLNVGPADGIWDDPAAGAAGVGLTALTSDINYPTPSGDWIGINGHAFNDGSDVWIRVPYSSPRTFKNGSQVTAKAGIVSIEVR